MILFHGLSAYSGTRKPLQQIAAADKCLGEEICTATRPIGPIGVMVSGDITGAFSRDCWSYVDSGGKRRPGCGEHIEAPTEFRADAARLEAWCRKWHEASSLAWTPVSDYCELFVVVRAITHVWVKPYVSDKFLSVARIIARRHGAQVVEVERNTRPWDVVGSYLPTKFERLAEVFGWEEWA